MLNTHLSFKACIRWMLIPLLLLQSIVAVADMHQSHQVENQHQVIVEHQHDEVADSQVFDLEASDFEGTDSKLDCHHCCHCHGSVCSVLPTSIVHLQLLKPNPHISYFAFQFSSNNSTSLYRPPIV